MLNNSSMRKRKLLAIIAFVLMLVAALTTCMSALANVTPTGNITCKAYMNLRHNPTGIGQSVLVNAWTTPNAPRWADLNLSVPSPGDPLWIPGTSATSGIPRVGYIYTITAPNGTVTTLNRTSDGPSSDWFIFTPDALGTWYVEFSWGGVTFKDNSGNVIVSFSSCTTGKQELVVQTEQIPYAKEAALPTDYWNYPINSENRAWYTISGPYLEPTTGTSRGYDSTGSRFNPYTRAPNTAHILWMDPPASGLAGIIGGQYGALVQYGATAGTINVVMAGKAYYTASNMIYCVDVRSGQRLWTVPGTYSFGLVENSSAPATEGGAGLYNGAPCLIYIGNNPTNSSQFQFIKYDGFTGAVKQNITTTAGGTYVYFGNDMYYAYVHFRPASVTSALSLDGPFYLLKINMLGSTSTLAQRTVWNVSYPFNAGDVGICIYADVLTNIHYPEYGQSGGINTTTGALLWSRNIDGIEQKVEAVTSANGVLFCSYNDQHFMAINMFTGAQVWVSPDQTAYPWGNFWAYGEATAYNMVYGLSYAGVYAFSQTDGKIVWHYSSGDSGEETPYGTWPFGSIDPIIADGKVFAPTSEHSPTIYYRGQRLHVIDAYAGTAVWSIMGYYTVGAVAEDTLFATNAYDGCKYAFARGNTSTTVSTDAGRIAKGESAWITGTIMDMSPAQPNTPCVSKDSMTGWMEYLHMQQPKPTNTTGVSVTLTAIKSDGSSVDIGKATSNEYGVYTFKWTPTDEDAYTIVANFEGDESYFSSSATTVLTVVPASSSASPSVPSSPSSPTSSESPSTSAGTSPSVSNANPTSNPGNTPGIGVETYVAIVAAIIVVVVVAVALFLRKRK
jgi:hypothetical protein